MFVVADNCTDNTAQVARDAGAIVFTRHNTKEVGKGYALDYGFQIHPQRTMRTRVTRPTSSSTPTTCWT